MDVLTVVMIYSFGFVVTVLALWIAQIQDNLDYQTDAQDLMVAAIWPVFVPAAIIAKALR